MKLGIIDLDTGNLASLVSAMNKLNIKFKICKNNFDFQDVDKIILPGVGAFKDFMKKIKNNGIDKILNKKIEDKIPLLGVCVGFQVLFEESNEHGRTEGLNLLKGKIKNFKDISKDIKVPHVGWNECKLINNNKLFQGIENSLDFYFTHSYFLDDCKSEHIISKTDYDTNFVSSINKENIYGVQFHPEKSQANGLKILKNFYEIC
ncbi:imidazole glycerol phosphate synthase subunit HisH [Candidatus Pelagibacter sp. Uisw_134_02]|uniref:imidazole glycerol phosphate synthase subunit HisH n=1 Tax=Candidatus Pelagibacter sp. Uisw_134_02 TaxID=3230990 RepID=UPI0039E8C725